MVKWSTNVKEQYGVDIKTTGSIGFSAMMHGYMVFDKDDNLLTPFRTLAQQYNWSGF